MEYKKIEDFKSPQEAVDFINGLIDELAAAKTAQADAELVAEKALAAADEAFAGAPKQYNATVAGVGKVKVNFGVDGKSKDEVLTDHELIANLVKKGSHAVTVLEAEEA